MGDGCDVWIEHLGRPSYSVCSFSAETRYQIYVLFPIAATGPEEVLLDCRHSHSHHDGALTEGSFAMLFI